MSRRASPPTKPFGPLVGALWAIWVEDARNTTRAFSCAFQSPGLKALGPAFTPVTAIIDGGFARKAFGIGG